MGGMTTSVLVTLPTQELLERLRPELPEDVRLEVWPMDGPSGLGHIDLAVMPYMAKPQLLDVLDGEDVAAVQAQSLGYDDFEKHLPEGVVLANAVGVHEDATAELTLALVLAAERGLDTYLREQREGEWRQRFHPGLIGRTVLLVGVGGVGRAIHRRLDAFGAVVLRSASRERSDELGTVHGPDALPELLAQADVVILGMPLTEQTRGMFDAGLMARMKQGALLVNIGRGPLVDTDALVEAARSGHIRAALDVMDPEPLPADHPLRQVDGVLITPHVGGRSSSMDDRIVELVTGQVQRLVKGEEIDHRVL